MFPRIKSVAAYLLLSTAQASILCLASGRWLRRKVVYFLQRLMPLEAKTSSAFLLLGSLASVISKDVCVRQQALYIFRRKPRLGNILYLPGVPATDV